MVNKKFKSLFFPRLAVFKDGAPSREPGGWEHTPEQHAAEQEEAQKLRGMTREDVMNEVEQGVKALVEAGTLYMPVIDKAKGTITFKANAKEFKVQLTSVDGGIFEAKVDDKLRMVAFKPGEIVDAIESYARLADGKDVIIAELEASGLQELQLNTTAGHPEIHFHIDKQSAGSFVFSSSNPGGKRDAFIAVSMNGTGMTMPVRVEGSDNALRECLVKAIDLASLIEISEELEDLGFQASASQDRNYVEFDLGKGKTVKVQKRMRATDSSISYEVYEGGSTERATVIKGSTLRQSVDQMVADLKVDNVE